MKKYRIALALILAAALTGCAKEGQSSDDPSAALPDSSATESSVSDNGGRPVDVSSGDQSSSESSSDSAASASSDESSEPHDPETSEPDPDATFLVGLAGDTIMRSDLGMIFTSDGTDGSPETFSEDNFSGVLCDGFVYLAEPSGVCRTSYDNADVFDSETARFTDVSRSSERDYKRIEVGETFCGLTLAEAQVNFAHGLDGNEYVLGDGSTKLGSELGFPEIYFMGGTAKFEGEVTLTGYICVAAEDEQSLMEGDIIFIPSDCECTLPVMGYRLDPDVGIVHYPRLNNRGDMYWQNDYGHIYLGSAYNTELDLSELPDDGSFAKVNVTFDGLKLTCGINMMESCTAELIGFEVL
ncbi:MAG: hypothetical protein K2N38_04785 [Oscillospiraceae bacterium]|nr:hypothetical protein [Oscillospiraceae bacterium]